MGTLQQIHQWSLTHHPRWLVVLRVALGLSLFVKGISFLLNTASLESIIRGNIVASNADWFVLGITWVHLLGGFLIVIGLLTRWAVLVQIPILMGAIVFINIQREAFPGFELPFAIMLLLLLLFFLVEGGGPISLDNYFKHHLV